MFALSRTITFHFDRFFFFSFAFVVGFTCFFFVRKNKVIKRPLKVVFLRITVLFAEEGKRKTSEGSSGRACDINAGELDRYGLVDRWGDKGVALLLWYLFVHNFYFGVLIFNKSFKQLLCFPFLLSRTPTNHLRSFNRFINIDIVK